MKIITRFESAWDEAQKRYVTVAEESYDYEGPVARCDLGGGGSSTTSSVPAKTETELAVDALTLKQLQRQDLTSEQLQPIIEQYIKEQKAQQEADVKAGITPEAKAARSAKSFKSAGEMDDINMELARSNLEAVKRGGAASPEQLTAINEATAAAQKTGEADIERFRTATLRQINEEVASASGLRPTDTPILRLSERAGEESARQQGQLTSRLADTNATARLNYPLASTKLTSDIASTQQSLSEAASQFTQQLNMRAQDNRFRLFAGSQPPGLSSVGFGASLANERYQNRTTTTENDPGFMGMVSGLGSASGGIGGLMRGASMFATAGSDRRLKRDIVRIGELTSGIPVYAFRYKGHESWFIGCMADEVLPIIPEAVTEDEAGIMYVNYAALH